MAVVVWRDKWENGWFGLEDEFSKFEVDSFVDGKPMKLSRDISA